MQKCVIAREWRAEELIHSLSHLHFQVQSAVTLHRCWQWGGGPHSCWDQIWSSLLRWATGHFGSPRGISAPLSKHQSLGRAWGYSGGFVSFSSTISFTGGKCSEDEALETEEGPGVCRELAVNSTGSKKRICAFTCGGHRGQSWDTPA